MNVPNTSEENPYNEDKIVPRTIVIGESTGRWQHEILALTTFHRGKGDFYEPKN